MILTLILGFLAGYAAPLAEPHVRKAMEGVTLSKIDVKDGEFDLLTLLLLLLVAAVLMRLLGVDGGPIALVLGGLLGVFGKRALDAFTGSRGDTE